MPLHTCHRHSSSTDRPPAQQLKHEQQQHIYIYGAWEEQLELCDRGRLQLDAGSVKAPFSRQKSRKIATVTKAPAKKSPAARNVVTHLLIPYRRRRCAAGRNPTPHGRTCGAAPTLRAGPNTVIMQLPSSASSNYGTFFTALLTFFSLWPFANS